jgi:hypothetical protein
MRGKDRMITIKKDYKCHTCTEDIPSILYPDLELYYVYNDHISIHNSSFTVISVTSTVKHRYQSIIRDYQIVLAQKTY